jgi:probable addiction module antidote protein
LISKIKTETPKKAAATKASASDYTTQLLEGLKDPAEAAAYIEAAIQEGDRDGLLVALRQVAAANGGMASIAEQTGLSCESLYRAFSKRGNPTVSTLSSVLAATGVRLSVQPA